MFTNTEKDGRGPADAIIPTMPEVKEHAARAIARAAKNGRRLIVTNKSELLAGTCLSVSACLCVSRVLAAPRRASGSDVDRRVRDCD